MVGSAESRQALIESTAGFVAGVAATLVAHPLDLVKTRLQVNRDTTFSRVGETFRVLRLIVRSEGGYRALYRGLVPNVVGNSASWGLYFLIYNEAKKTLSDLGGRNQLTSSDFFLASATAGILTAAATNPIWVVKTRMLSTSSTFEGAYATFQDGVRQIYRLDGLRGFYRGLVPSLLGVSHGAIQFVVYEKLKIYRHAQLHVPHDLNSMDYVILSGLSKVVAGTATYPYQVVRSRLQIYDVERSYHGLVDVVTQTMKHEGLAGFYRGIGPNLLRVLPSTCVTFLVYETSRNFLAQKGSD